MLKAADEAKRLKDDYVSVEHLLLALIDEDNKAPAGRILKEVGVTHARFLEALTAVRGNQRVASANPEGTYEALQKYGMDLVALARQGKLDPVIGRDQEIRSVIRILSRKTKTIPCLSANRAWARLPSWRAWPTVLSAAMSRRDSRTILFFHWT